MEDLHEDKETKRVPQPEDVAEKELFSWEAPARPFRKRSREFYSTVGVIVLLLSVILFFAREFLLIGVVLSLAFVSYALASVPPGEITYTLTNKGIYLGTIFHPYVMLGRFWFEEKWKQDLLMIEYLGGFPNVLTAVLTKNKDKVEEILKEYMLLQKPTPSPMDKAAEWLSKKIPLETES